MTFRPATGGQMLLTTALACTILLAMGVLFLVLGYQYRERGGAHYALLVGGCVILVLLVGSLGFRIRSYQINSGNLVIKVGFSAKTLSLKGLESVRTEDRPFAGCRRDFGVGGFWSNYGRFTSPRWGKFLAYASDTSRGVLLVWPDEKVLVTPADVPSFLQALKPKQ